MSLRCVIRSSLALAAMLAGSAAPFTRAEEVKAIPANEFLDSIGVNTTFPDRGQPLEETIKMLKYGGFRWVRGGIEGLSDHGLTTLRTLLDLHRATGVRFSWSLGSGGTDVKKLIDTGEVMAEARALLAFEGNNEPNNWGVTYQGESGGGHAPSWVAVAKLERDMYAAVKSNPALAKYPVWSISEGGAERDNAGLQFLTIPAGANTLLPAGTRLADYANCHNYVYHPNSREPADNKTWNASDPTPACRVDGLYGNFGLTWAKKYPGYPQPELDNLPKVTTETGAKIEGPVTEQMQGLNLMSIYLDQFKRGWSYTSVYLLRDRTDEGGNETFGFFRPDYTSRKAAVYLHNLTTILADDGPPAKPGLLDYVISPLPETVHEMLLQQAGGTFQLVVWDERLHGEDHVTIRFGTKHPSIRIYDPTLGAGAIRSLTSSDSCELTLSDHPLVITIPLTS
jgi:hypothetical protein